MHAVGMLTEIGRTSNIFISFVLNFLEEVRYTYSNTIEWSYLFDVNFFLLIDRPLPDSTM